MNEVLSYFSVVIGDGQIAATGGVVSSNSMTRPVLIEPMSNETVAVGRDAILRCVVKHLQDYKVLLPFNVTIPTPVTTSKIL